MMKRISFIYIAVICLLMFVLFLPGCTKDSGKTPAPQVPTASPVPPITTQTATITDPCDTVTYTRTIRPIFVKVCLRCHGDVNPSAGFSLNSYALLKVKADNGRLAARVIRGEGGFMPQGRAMSADTLSLINCWIKNNTKP